MARSYDYATRRGELSLTWEWIELLAHELVERLAAQHFDAVIGISRGGLIPATMISAALRLNLYPVGLSRREGEVVGQEQHEWYADVLPVVAGGRIVVIDEIADSGGTLVAVATRARQRGAAAVVTAALVAHSWAAPNPDLVGLVSDELVVFPWDRRIFEDGRWQEHPELEAARREQ